MSEKNKHISAEVIVDSINNGHRVTSLKVRMPRLIHAEFCRHRMFSMNFESSRAVPTRILRKEVLENPFVPVYWGSSQKGMVAGEELAGLRKRACKVAWIGLSKVAVFAHWCMEKAGLHKQTANRILEPWLSITGVCTCTDADGSSGWDHFFALRCSHMAQPEMQMLAWEIRDALKNSTPVERIGGDSSIDNIHLPFIDHEDMENVKHDLSKLTKISAARCARASYNNFYGRKSQPEEDLKLFNTLVSHGHLTPLEHVAMPIVEGIDPIYHCRNLRGWTSLRSFIDPEDRRQLLKDTYGIDLMEPTDE